MKMLVRLVTLLLAFSTAYVATAGQAGTLLSPTHSLFEQNIGQADKRWHYFNASPNYTTAIGSSHISFSFKTEGATRADINEQVSKAEVAFPPQESNSVDLISRTDTVDSTAATMSSHVSLDMIIEGGNEKAIMTGLDRQLTKTHRLHGRTEQSWISDIPNYGSVRATNVYPGVDVVYSTERGNLRFDFVVAAKAATDQIKLTFEGADNIKIEPDGSLLISVESVNFEQKQPFIYQESNGKKQRVAGRYQQLDANTVGFTIDDYDRKQALIIDPTVTYASYIGGSGDDTVVEVEKLDDGSLLVAGYTSLPDFAPGVGSAGSEVFIAKINSDGLSFDFITYLGGSGGEQPNSLILDSVGNIVLAGITGSPDFPMAAAFDSSFAGGYPFSEMAEGNDGFVTRLAADGATIIHSSYLGGANTSPDNSFIGYELMRNAELRASDDAVVLVGETGATDFPVTAILNGRACMETDANDFGSAFTSDVFVSIVGSAGQLISSTCLGGSERDGARDVTIIPDTGEIAVIGTTRSADFPVTASVFQSTQNVDLSDFNYDGFVTILSDDLSEINRSTYIGGSGQDYNETISVNSRSQLVVGGITTSLDFPMTVNGAQPQSGSLGLPTILDPAIGQDAYFFLMDSALTGVSAATYYGGDFLEQMFVAELDDQDRIYFAGLTWATDLPLKNALQIEKGRRIGEEKSFIPADSAIGYGGIELDSIGELVGGARTSEQVQVFARGGPGGATNKILSFTDYFYDDAVIVDLGTAVSDTRVIEGGFNLLSEADLNRSAVVTGNCNDVNRIYEVDSNGNATLMGEFGDTDFCTQGVAFAQLDQGFLFDVVIHDGNTLRYFINLGEGDFTEDLTTGFPTSFVNQMSVVRGGGNGLFVGDYGGADKYIRFIPSQSPATWVETTLGNGNKKTTDFHFLNTGFTGVIIAYDDSPMDFVTSSNGTGESYDTATAFGRTDTDRVFDMSVEIEFDGTFTLYAYERAFNGDTLLTCYCRFENSNLPTYDQNETINRGPVEYASLHFGANRVNGLYSQAKDGAAVSFQPRSDGDAFLGVLSHDLSRFEFSSYWGGPGFDSISWGLKLESSGKFTVGGVYSSSGLPGVSIGTSADNTNAGLSEGFVASINVRDVLDYDEDEVIDINDNCLLVANAAQTDSDNDGFGNICDGDFNQDQVTNFLDLIIFSEAFLTSGFTVTDMNGDGVTNFIDLPLFSQVFLQEPGPAGLD